MKEKIIIISPDGEIKTIYNDELQEMDLGALSVKRASNVEFDEDSQKWRIVDAETDSLIGVGFDKRSDAIDYEVQFLNGRLAVSGE
jgi:hypothetical protein